MNEHDLEFYLDFLSDDQLLELNNMYTVYGGIYYNNEEFFEMFSNGYEVAKAVFYGNYNPSHKFAKLDYYGNIESSNYVEVLINGEELINQLIINDYQPTYPIYLPF